MISLLLPAVLGASLRAPSMAFQTLHWKQEKKGWWEASVDYPKFQPTKLGLLANRTLAKELAFGKEFVTSTNKDQKERGKPSDAYYYASGFTAVIASPDLLTISFGVDRFDGGAHGMQNSHLYNFGIVHGTAKHLRLKDLFRPGVNARSVTSKIVIGKLMKDDQAMWVQNGDVKALTPEFAEQFIVTKTGLHFDFDPYQMGPYSSGPIEVDVTFAELGNSLDKTGPLRSLLALHR